MAVEDQDSILIDMVYIYIVYQPTIPTNTIVYMWDLRYASLTINPKKAQSVSTNRNRQGTSADLRWHPQLQPCQRKTVKKPLGDPPNLAAQTLLQASKKI